MSQSFWSQVFSNYFVEHSRQLPPLKRIYLDGKKREIKSISTQVLDQEYLIQVYEWPNENWCLMVTYFYKQLVLWIKNDFVFIRNVIVLYSRNHFHTFLWNSCNQIFWAILLVHYFDAKSSLEKSRNFYQFLLIFLA